MAIDFQPQKLRSKDPKVKYGYAKELKALAAEQPALLLDYMDVWLAMLNEKNKIFQWNAAQIVGMISIVDVDRATESCLPRMYELLHEGDLVTTENVLPALGMMALHNLEKRSEILHKILETEHVEFKTKESGNIVIGKLINELMKFSDYVKTNPEAMAFIERSVGNSRHSTKVFAEKALKNLRN